MDDLRTNCRRYKETVGGNRAGVGFSGLSFLNYSKPSETHNARDRKNSLSGKGTSLLREPS